MFLGIGQVAGPLFGSICNKHLGFRMTCDLVAIMSLLFSMSYYVFADGAKAFKKSQWIDVAPEDVDQVLNRSYVPIGRQFRTPCSSNASFISRRLKLRGKSQKSISSFS